MTALPTFPPVAWEPDDQSHRRKLGEGLNRTMSGKLNALLDVTLAANAASTTVTDPRIGGFSGVYLEPMTANAALEIGGTRVAQVVNYETGLGATGTTVFPTANTIPTSAAGDQYMQLAITPTNAASTLLIDMVWIGGNSTGNVQSAGLFQDSTVNALVAAAVIPAFANLPIAISFRHKMIAGTTSPTTFKVRSGSNAAGTTTFNGWNGAQFFGGVMASSITITEVLPAASLSIAAATMKKGSLVITHANNAQVDRIFRMLIVG